MKSLLFALAVLLTGNCYAQTRVIDSLNKLLSTATSDTQRINISLDKVAELNNINLDSGIALGNKIIAESRKIHYKKGEARAIIAVAGDFCFKGDFDSASQFLGMAGKILSETNDSVALARMNNIYGLMYSMQNKFNNAYGYYEKAADIAGRINETELLSSILQNTAICYQQQSNYPKALEHYQRALDASEKAHDEAGMAYIYLNMAITYSSIDDKSKAEEFYLKAIGLAKKLQLKNVEAYANSNIASLYGSFKDYKKEYEYGMRATELGEQIGDIGIQASSLSRAAFSLAHQSDFEGARKLMKRALQLADISGQPYNICQAYSGMGNILVMQEEYKKAIPYFEKAFHSLSDSDLYSAEVSGSYANLSECYEKTGDYKKALFTYKIAAKITDSITGRENIKKATELTLNYEFDKKQQLAKVAQERKDAIADRVKTRQYFIIAALAILVLSGLFIAIIQFRNNKQKYKANLLLSRQKLKAEKALTELKSAQAQLIQSEKMASLGELTAGVAHEIQNPLNFVNNFSEVNNEMIDEVREEISKGNLEEAKNILNDIQDNSEKITHHGKRADAIVKGMLQHSRSSTGQRELTDINTLADEYLRLSYHGLRAKDKSFKAEMKADFDTSLEKINVVPQDIGRVLLNLFNNAFYAANEKGKDLQGFVPLVTATTQKTGDMIQIKVADNGNGIPPNIREKIFQPFFTTKPTGEGTGLGLSLSYDIVKTHGGDIKIETQEGEGTTFVVELPATSGA